MRLLSRHRPVVGLLLLGLAGIAPAYAEPVEPAAATTPVYVTMAIEQRYDGKVYWSRPGVRPAEGLPWESLTEASNPVSVEVDPRTFRGLQPTSWRCLPLMQQTERFLDVRVECTPEDPPPTGNGWGCGAPGVAVDVYGLPNDSVSGWAICNRTVAACSATASTFSSWSGTWEGHCRDVKARDAMPFTCRTIVQKTSPLTRWRVTCYTTDP